ncbi:MAG: immune inhibitor A [Anaerolineales bacterium]|nr:immune inhibitor A [Anaerolineales bacterium]
MSWKTFFSLVLIGFLVAACGGAAATQQAASTEAPAAPAATEAPAQIAPQAPSVSSESEFNSISTEKASTADVNLYKSLSAYEPAPVNEVSLALAIENVDPAKIQTAPNQPVNTYQLGQSRTFWVRNTSTLQFNLINAKLMWISNHAYFWQDMNVNQENTAEDWAAAGASFDNSYERVRSVFGTEQSLGLDGDPRLFVVHSNDVGDVGGYFSELDQLPAAVEEHSNEGQYFFISNEKSSGITSEYYKEVLAHEFQHMIQKNVDVNEEAWLDEGLSMLAQQVAGMRGDNWVKEYLSQPDQSLWFWGKNSADYGQSYLYLDYLYEQLGEEFIKALSADSINGTVSIDQTLKTFKSTRNADDLYIDSISAAFFNDRSSPNNQFAYQIPSLPSVPPIFESESFPQIYQGTVQQYGGVDILTFIGEGNATLIFNGDQRIKLIPADAHSGDRFWWSNRDDSTFATLTRKVDLTQTPTATLKYWAWYNLEENWDYAYLLVSTDNGNHWTPISATSSRVTDPNGQNHGYGFSGISGTQSEAIWIQETANLNAYAGRQILLRFVMQTNRSVNNFGFAIDDLSIPEIGWTDNVEAGKKDWTSEGFIAIHNHVPQIWGVRAVEQKMDNTLLVHDLNIKNGTAQLEIDFSDLNRLVVFVIGQTRYTTLPASYQVEVSP